MSQVNAAQNPSSVSTESPRPAQPQGKAMLALHFGAICHPLAKQLMEQGVRMNAGIRGSASIWQKDADAITRLAVRQLLPDSAARNARRKLLKRIIRGIEANSPASLQKKQN